MGIFLKPAVSQRRVPLSPGILKGGGALAANRFRAAANDFQQRIYWMRLLIAVVLMISIIIVALWAESNGLERSGTLLMDLAKVFGGVVVGVLTGEASSRGNA